jgi:hemerythrin-like metal-binding protein
MGALRTGLLPETLRVGFPEIDGQHEEIFSRIETLKAACFGNSDLPVDEFRSLLESVALHFASEERLAEQSAIEFSDHATIHLQNLQSMQDALDVVLGGVSEAYSFLRFTEFWFERHIVQYDQPFVADLQRIAR